MAFYAQNFIFDDVPSEEYGLIISSGSAEDTSDISNAVSLRTQKVYRNPKPYFYGVEQEPVLEFDIELRTTETELTAEDASLIQKWLFGHMNYKKLRIVQPDMEDYYYNCILTQGTVYKVGNLIRGFNAKVVCDSPFAWGQEISTTLTTLNTTLNFWNRSENNDYTLPQLTVTMLAGSADVFAIINETEGRTFSMNGMSVGGGDVITIDSRLQIIEAENTPSPLSKVVTGTGYGYFFRLVPGLNQLMLTGNIQSLNITYTPEKRMV